MLAIGFLLPDGVPAAGRRLRSAARRLQRLARVTHATPRVDTDFNIEVEFQGGLSPSQRAAFKLAAARWAELITGNLPSATIENRPIDDVLIFAKGARIDGPNGVLGQAGTTFIRTNTKLPIQGIMEFDVDDLNQMESNGTLIDVIIHEMGGAGGDHSAYSRQPDRPAVQSCLSGT